ncbi:MAG: hypothetical protein A2Y40_02730 [Candidatus Margulisbacteria bacterium GWF2_35_9]|nr:MAG: hypothetical protein A2Y40_02730 [Candidatus Margulisbacteria bacterium GWF2_35_9]
MVDILETLIQSKVKRKLLKLFLFNKNIKYHTRAIGRVIDEPISAVQRELKKLVESQVLIKYPEGNIINYFLNTQNPFYPDLKKIVLKTTTEPKDYFKLLIKTASLERIALFGETVKSPMKFSEPVHLLVVGLLDKDILNEYIKAIMEVFNRECDLVYLSPDEYKKKKDTDKALQKIINNKNFLVLKES